MGVGGREGYEDVGEGWVERLEWDWIKVDEICTLLMVWLSELVGARKQCRHRVMKI